MWIIISSFLWHFLFRCDDVVNRRGSQMHISTIYPFHSSLSSYLCFETSCIWESLIAVRFKSFLFNFVFYVKISCYFLFCLSWFVNLCCVLYKNNHISSIKLFGTLSGIAFVAHLIFISSINFCIYASFFLPSHFHM